ncbi:transcription factor E2F3 [Brachionichthys hirsutus]|uniref:transcription factor E2F3 n=1 Tax=Brachionichthys hirsutus TaxID=412623 RepID=UPI003604533F
MPSEESPDPLPADPFCKTLVTRKAPMKRKIPERDVAAPQQNADTETRNTEVEDAATAAADKPDSLHTPKDTRTRYDTSLVLLTQKFAELVNRSADGVMELNDIASALQVRKRRVYDVTNVLEGIHLLVKPSKNHIKWLGSNWSEKNAQDLGDLIQAEKHLDELIESCVLQIYQMYEDQHSLKYPFDRDFTSTDSDIIDHCVHSCCIQTHSLTLMTTFAYVTYDDVQSIPSFKDQAVMVIKAPVETELEVPHPTESLQVHLRSTTGPIEVFVCSDGPTKMNSRSSSSTDANLSAPLLSNSSHPKDDPKHPFTITTSSLMVKLTQHTLPAPPITPASSQ